MKWFVALSRARAAIFTFGFLFGISALSKAQAKNEEPMLIAALTSDRTDYSLADNIQLDVRITNAGRSELTVYSQLLWGHAGGLVLHVSDASNKEIPAKTLDDDMVVPATLADPKSFIVLSPNHYLGTTRVEHLTELVEKPGIYFIQVEYKSPVPRKFGQGPNLWSREKPPLLSNTIRVRVTGK
jgi:hypothetical protein